MRCHVTDNLSCRCPDHTGNYDLTDMERQRRPKAEILAYRQGQRQVEGLWPDNANRDEPVGWVGKPVSPGLQSLLVQGHGPLAE